MNESKEELLQLGIVEMRERYKKHVEGNHRAF